MSWPIIFETKIVRLPDGRIIHFDRSGCNNDTSGRKKDEFSAEIYTVEKFVEYAEHLKSKSVPIKDKDADEFELKIGNRYATNYDYGEHLLRMLNRAKPYEEFIKAFYVKAEHLIGIQLHHPQEKFMTVKEFDKEFYGLLYDGHGMSFTQLIEYPDINNEKEIITLIEAKEPLSFEIISRKSRHKN